MHNLATQLKKIRLEKNLTQKQVAEGIDITEQSYQRYEYGRVVPSAAILIALAQYFDVPLDYLAGNGIFANWEDVIEYWDIILGEVGKLKFEDGHFSNLAELLQTYSKQVEGDKIKIGAFLSTLIAKIDFDKSTDPISIKIYWKY